ncbi:hypothetical protein D3C71_2119900 [compost metagenome]
MYFAFDNDDQLARDPGDARSDWAVPERRGGGRNDLSQRRDPPELCGLLDGVVHQRELDWRHERTSAERGVHGSV